MNFYRQSIILFGVVIPLVLAVGIVALGHFMKTKMHKSYLIKKENYSMHHQARSQAVSIESQVLTQRPDLERWDQQLSQETASAVGSNLREISESLPNKEIQQTAFDPSNNNSGFGQACAQNASSIRIGFRGTYRTLQKAFLELETRMPQLQLEELSLQPVTTSGYLLTLQVTYTAWEK